MVDFLALYSIGAVATYVVIWITIFNSRDVAHITRRYNMRKLILVAGMVSMVLWPLALIRIIIESESLKDDIIQLCQNRGDPDKHD